MTNKEEFEDTKGNQNEEEQTTQWPKDRRTNNTMAKRQKNKQHDGQKTEEQTTQWPKDRRTNNTMAKRQSTKVQTTIYKIYTEI